MTDPATPTDTDDGFSPIDFLETAVATPSHEDVREMRTLLVETLAKHDIEATIDSHGSVIATKRSPAPDAGPHVVMNTHIDTVTPHVPFERDRQATAPATNQESTHGSSAAAEGEAGDRTTDVIRGRGACDAKGPLAALLAGFLAVSPPRGRLTLAVTPDEETLSLGAAALMGLLPGTTDQLAGDLFIVGEPTGLDVCTAAKGRFQGTVSLSGVTAHAAEFAGINAVAAAEDALRAIRTFDANATAHSQLGPPKLTPTTIEGGGATNQVPADCAIVVDRRSVPPESAEGFRSALATEVRAETPDEVDIDVTLTERDSPFLEAFATDPEHELVETMATATTGAVRAGELQPARGGRIRPFGAATEASYFAPAPTVVFGPGDLADAAGAVAHADREYVRVHEVEVASTAITNALTELIG